MRISEDELLEDINGVRDRLDRVPTAREYREHGNYDTKTVLRRFGTWNNALYSAGIAKRDKGRNIEVNIDDVMNLYYGEGISIEDVGNRLDLGTSTILRELRNHDVPTNIPANIRYLIYNGPSTIDELPGSEVTVLQRSAGVSSFKTKIPRENVVYYLAEDHPMDDVIRKYIESNRSELQKFEYSKIINKLRSISTDYSNIASSMLDRENFKQ